MSDSLRIRERCALCDGSERLEGVMDLAATPPANEFVKEGDVGLAQEKFPLSLLLCGGCGHLQLAEIVDPKRLFHHYVYVSGTSPVFVGHFDRYAETAISRFGLGRDSLVVDVGSNDGTLLKQFQRRGIGKVLGVDPAAEIAADARKAGIPTVEAFFTSELARTVKAERGGADLISANNVFAHAEDLAEFARGVATLLSPQGVFVFEVSYLVDVVEKMLFDTIYHEHVSYHALQPLIQFFDRLGLQLFDAERIDTHGGSLRCYVSLAGASHAPTDRRENLVRHEQALGLFSATTYAALKQRIVDRGRQLRERLTHLRSTGKTVAGFGAPAKLTTLMHEFGLDRHHVEFIVDDSTWKQGLYTPGNHIPVVPSTFLYERKPDYCVVFAWNFADSITAKHERYAAQGGHFIVPLPEMREIP